MSAINVYLAGPMRGIKGYNQQAFIVATACLRDAGFNVFSPAEEDRRKFPDRDWDNMTGDIAADGLTFDDMRVLIRADLNWICDNANMLVLLPGWDRSKGAKLEKALAEFLGLEIRFWDNHTMTLLDANA